MLMRCRRLSVREDEAEPPISRRYGAVDRMMPPPRTPPRTPPRATKKTPTRAGDVGGGGNRKSNEEQKSPAGQTATEMESNRATAMEIHADEEEAAAVLAERIASELGRAAAERADRDAESERVAAAKIREEEQTAAASERVKQAVDAAAAAEKAASKRIEQVKFAVQIQQHESTC